MVIAAWTRCIESVSRDHTQVPWQEGRGGTCPRYDLTRCDTFYASQRPSRLIARLLLLLLVTINYCRVVVIILLRCSYGLTDERLTKTRENKIVTHFHLLFFLI